MIISQTATLLLVPKNSSAQKNNAKSHFTATKANPIPLFVPSKATLGQRCTHIL